MKLIYKIWFENFDGMIFGEGPCRLLRGIEKTGSIRQAAADMGIAYSKARHIIKTCENNLGFALTHSRRGGITRGGSEVTDQAFELMKLHESLCGEIELAIGKIYEKHFGQKIPVLFYPGTKRYRRQSRIETINEAGWSAKN